MADDYLRDLFWRFSHLSEQPWIKSTFIIPKVLTIGNTNYYYAMMADASGDSGKKKPFHRRGSRHKRKVIKKQNEKSKRQKKAK